LQSIHTTNIIPVDLNALLYLTEKTIAKSFEVEGDHQQSSDFLKKAEDRAILMNKWLWNNELGIFTDYNFVEQKFGVPSLAMMFPLFANISSQLQAERSIHFLSDIFFVREDGLQHIIIQANNGMHQMDGLRFSG
jgi:alpha,alpha-trehalase